MRVGKIYGLHYAWVVAGVTFAALQVAGGVRGSPGILVVPLETEFGWSRATISLAIGINIFLYGLSGPFAAALMERFGLRRTTLGGLTTIGVGVLATPSMHQPWHYGLRGLSLIYLPFAFVSFYGLSLFAVFYGLDWIATVPPTIRLTANTFGSEKTGMMYGWITAIHQLGGASAALLGGILC